MTTDEIICKKITLEGHCVIGRDIYHYKCNDYSAVDLQAPDGNIKRWCYNCGFLGLQKTSDKKYKRPTAYTRWSQRVRYRDNFTCKLCESKENVEAHHIFHWEGYESLRFVDSNGITLCKECHKKIHKAIKENDSGTEIEIYRNLLLRINDSVDLLRDELSHTKRCGNCKYYDEYPWSLGNGICSAKNKEVGKIWSCCEEFSLKNDCQETNSFRLPPFCPNEL